MTNVSSVNLFHSVSNELVLSVKRRQLDAANDIIKFLCNYNRSVGELIVDICYCTKNRNLYNEFEDANVTTGNVLCLSKDALEHHTEEKTETLNYFSNQWAISQTLLMEKFCCYLSPWLDLLKDVFECSLVAKILTEKTPGNSFKKHLKNLKLLKFEVCKLVSHYEKGFTYAIAYDDKIRVYIENLCNTVNLLQASYAKVVKLVKQWTHSLVNTHTHLDTKLVDCLNFNLWMFYCAHFFQKVLFYLDIVCHSVSKNELNFEFIQSLHKQWLSLGKQTLISCDSIASTELIKDQIAALEVSLIKIHDNLASTPVERCLSIIAIYEWKIKIFDLSRTTYLICKDVSLPVDALVAAACNWVIMPSDLDKLLSVKNKNLSSKPFKEIKRIFKKKLERIRLHACLAVGKVASQSDIHRVLVILDALDEISNEILLFCYRKKTSYNLATCEMWFQSLVHLLRMKWIVTVNSMLFELRKIEFVRCSAVSAIMRHLHSAQDVSSSQEFQEVINENPNIISFIKPSNNCLPSAFLYNNSPSNYLDSLLKSEEKLDSVIVKINCNKEQVTKTQLLSQFPENDLQENKIEQKQGSELVTAEHERYLEINLSADVPISLGKAKKPLRKIPPHVKLKDKIAKNHNLLLPLNDIKAFEEISSSNVTTVSVADQTLQTEIDQWESKKNSIIQIVKQMLHQMVVMDEFLNGKGNLKTVDDLILEAKAIAANSQIVASFLILSTAQCSLKSCEKELRFFAERILTFSTQLKIVASVKSEAGHEKAADAVLIKNVENLMKAVVDGVKCVGAVSLNMDASETFNHQIDVINR